MLLRENLARPGALARLCCLVLVLGIIQGARAQDRFSGLTARVRYAAARVKAGDLLDALHRQTGYSFLYDRESVGNLSLDNVRFDNITLGGVLEWLQRNYGLQFSMAGRNIAVRADPAFKGNKVAPVHVTGQVRDSETKEPLPGVNVTVRSTGRTAVTDEAGRFSLDGEDPGAVLIFSIVGYASQTRLAGEMAGAPVLLGRQTRTLGEVVVEARRRANTEAAVLDERKNSGIVSDGISAQNIERTASITTTQALQRVTGVTVTDGKYIAIRGLGDRSVIAEMNGARLSSADPDRSAVPLDLVPASLLDNITVYKTLSPDHPADASAGIIELKTKSVPDALIVQFVAEVGTNSTIGIGGKVNSFQDSNMGFLAQNIKTHDLSQAFLNLQNQYPGGLQQIQRLFIESRNSPAFAAESYRINQIMLSFDPVLTTSYKKAQPDQIYSATVGNTFHIFGGHALGLILSANYYRRSEDRYHGELNQYSLYQGVVTGAFDQQLSVNGQTYYTPTIYSPLHIPPSISPDNPRLGKYLGYVENSGTETISYGGLAGLTYRFNAHNEVQVQYIGSRGGEISASNLEGSFQNTGLQYPVYNQVNQLRQTFRTFNTLNVQGEHKLGGKYGWPQLSYNLSTSTSRQDEPDFRFTDLADERTLHDVNPNGVGVGGDIYAFIVGSVHGIGPTGVIGADPNGRQYRDLVEHNYNTKADLTETLKFWGTDQVFKAGFNYLYRDRTFTENILGLPGTNEGGDNGLLQQVDGNLNELVSYNNIGLKVPSNYDGLGQPRVGGFLYQIKKSPDNYTGTFATEAFYGMADLHLTKQLRLMGGVRFETTDIETHVDTTNVYNPLANIQAINNGQTPGGGVSTAAANPNIIYSRAFSPYYSGNLTYTLHGNMNLRLAYSTSLARPEIRELTNIFEFDPFQFAVVVGNPALVNQLTRSEDFRWEWFPAKGEVISASAFAKQIDHQLEKVFIYNSQGNQSLYPEFPIVEFQNDPNPGYVYGVEFEIRKSLGVLWAPLQHLFLGANMLGAYSEVDKNPARLDASRTNDRHAPATSPLFEQPPYSVNAYLDYDNTHTGTNLTVSFNVVGERLIQVQLDGTPDLYDRPAPALDFVFGQKLGKRFLVKGFAKNILNPPYREVYTYPGQGGKFYGSTYIHHAYYKGTQYSLGLTYNLF